MSPPGQIELTTNYPKLGYILTLLLQWPFVQIFSKSFCKFLLAQNVDNLIISILKDLLQILINLCTQFRGLRVCCQGLL